MQRAPVSVSVGAAQAFEVGSTHTANVGLVNQMDQDLELIVTLASKPNSEGKRAYDSVSWEVSLPQGQQVTLNEQILMSPDPVTDGGTLVEVQDALSGEQWTFEFPYTVVGGSPHVGPTVTVDGITASINWGPALMAGTRHDVYVTLEATASGGKLLPRIESIPNSSGRVAYASAILLPEVDLPVGGRYTWKGTVDLASEDVTDGGTLVAVSDRNTGGIREFNFPPVTVSSSAGPYEPATTPEPGDTAEIELFKEWLAEFVLKSGYFGRIELDHWDWFSPDVPTLPYSVIELAEVPTKYTRDPLVGILPAGLYDGFYAQVSGIDVRTMYDTVHWNLYDRFASTSRGIIYDGPDLKLGDVVGPHGYPVYFFIMAYPDSLQVNRWLPKDPTTDSLSFKTSYDWVFWEFWASCTGILYEYCGEGEPDYWTASRSGGIPAGYLPIGLVPAAAMDGYINCKVVRCAGYYHRETNERRDLRFDNMSLAIRNLDEVDQYDRPIREIELSFDYTGPAPVKFVPRIMGVLWTPYDGGTSLWNLGPINWDENTIPQQGRITFIQRAPGHVDPAQYASIYVEIGGYDNPVPNIYGNWKYYFSPDVVEGEYLTPY